MSIRFTSSINGKNVGRLLTYALPKNVSRAEDRALLRLLPKAIALAKDNAPISPTKRQYVSSLKGRIGKGGKRLKKQTTRTDFNPGALTRSITGRVTKKAGVKELKLMVPRNSPASKYAKWIHEGRYNRGPGTRAKGPQADRKYMTRALKTLRPLAPKVVRDEIAKELRTIL